MTGKLPLIMLEDFELCESGNDSEKQNINIKYTVPNAMTEIIMFDNTNNHSVLTPHTCLKYSSNFNKIHSKLMKFILYVSI